jgi:hypothetical protein
LILGLANDNHYHLLFTVFQKKILTLGFTLTRSGFWLEYKNSVLGMGPPGPTPTGPKLGVSVLKKPPMHQIGAL